MCGALRAAATPSVCTGGKTGERGGVPFWCPSQHGASFGVQLVKSESLRVCVCVCMCASMCVCYDGAKNAQRKPTEVPRASGRRACLSGRVVCGAGWAMCSCEGRAWTGEGVSRGEKTPRACRCGPTEPLRPPRPRAGQPTVFCAPHSPAQAVGCAAREAGAGSGGWQRREARTRRSAGGGGPPHAQRRVRAFAGLRRARALEPKEMRPVGPFIGTTTYGRLTK